MLLPCQTVVSCRLYLVASLIHCFTLACLRPANLGRFCGIGHASVLNSLIFACNVTWQSQSESVFVHCVVSRDLFGFLHRDPFGSCRNGGFWTVRSRKYALQIKVSVLRRRKKVASSNRVPQVQCKRR